MSEIYFEINSPAIILLTTPIETTCFKQLFVFNVNATHKKKQILGDFNASILSV